MSNDVTLGCGRGALTVEPCPVCERRPALLEISYPCWRIGCGYKKCPEFRRFEVHQGDCELEDLVHMWNMHAECTRTKEDS